MITKILQITFNMFATPLISLWLLYIASYILKFKIITLQTIFHFILAFITLGLLWNFVGNWKKYSIGLLVGIFFACSIFLPDITDIVLISNCYKDGDCKMENLQKYKQIINNNSNLDDYKKIILSN